MHVLCLSAASSLLGRVYVASMLLITWTSWLTELMTPRKQPRYGWQALPTLQFDLILLCSDLDECFLLPRHRKSLGRLCQRKFYPCSSTSTPLSCWEMLSRRAESAMIQHQKSEKLFFIPVILWERFMSTTLIMAFVLCAHYVLCDTSVCICWYFW